MSILLIYPYFLEDRIHEEEIAVPPMGVYFVGALLKEHGFDVEILDLHRMRGRMDEIEKMLAEKKPEVIGFSILHANRLGAVDIAKAAKRLNPDVKIVFGGIGATFLWEHLMANVKEIDAAVIGEGEYSFLNLINAFQNPEKYPLSCIKGIVYREKDGNGEARSIFTGPADPVENIDELPNPAKYFTYQHLSLTRGCPSGCRFCGSPRMWGRKVRFHSAEYFVQQLWLLNAKGIGFFYFSDDTFTLRRDLVIQVCQLIVQRGLNIQWAAISQVNHIDEGILHWMRKAGCIQISYGVESGSETIRKRLNKKLSVEKIKFAFENTVKYGILPRAYFIYGNPGETMETIRESCDLMDEIKPLAMISYILDIFPGTALYDAFKERTGKTDDIWLEPIEDLLYFETDPELSKADVLVFGKTLRTHFYTRLKEYVDAVRLADKKSLYVYHADFLSRLGLTFSMGDYAKIDEIPDKDEIAENLFLKAIKYYPDRRAFLGLGMLYQQQRKFVESIRILLLGARYYTYDEELNVCLGVSYMNMNQFESAEICFRGFQNNPDVLNYLAMCYKELGNEEKKAEILRKIESAARR